MVYVKDILKGIRLKTKSDLSGLKVNNVTCDSASAKSGDAFIAMRGHSVDGHKFVKDVISKGVKVILAEKDFRSPSNVKKVLVRDMRSAIPIISNNFYSNPSKRLRTIGVTGTNGKTTITYLIENILKAAGLTPAVIGTINYRFVDKALPAKNTTPGPLELGSLMADMIKEGVDCVIMEASSHSLDQHRVDGVSLDAAIFTNITSDHLDYHKTAKKYLTAKAKIFGLLKSSGVAILNADDKRVMGLKNKIKKKVLTYGLMERADIKAENMKLSLNGSTFLAVTPEGPVEIKTNLIGAHNVSNILAGIAAALSAGIGLGTIKEGIGSFGRVPGRLEEVRAGQPFKVLVDYAHTEDALNNVLSLLRGVAEKHIITVFGCGGNRDRKKRPLMGRAACRFSDRAIITSDNPRFEKPMNIIKEIEKGVKRHYSNYEIIEDRRRAIERALNIASEGDIVVIAGKGHEKHQLIKNKVVPFDDCEVARVILKRRYESKGNLRDN